MSQFLSEYSLFLAETATIVLAIVAVIIVIFALKGDSKDEEDLEIKSLNDKYDRYTETLQHATLPRHDRKTAHKLLKQQRKAHENMPVAERKRIFVIDFDGDLRASAATTLAQEITAISTVARASDEVFVRLYSTGGLVHGYGLAAAQLQRLNDKNIPLTVSVDKVAASGGYMMACVAQRIIASPFAIIGSIGVVAQIPNFHRFLQKHDVDFELLTAGKYKRTLTMFGENTDAAREKFQQEIESTHGLFKDFVSTHRPIVDIETVATGEYWHGKTAVDLKLVDALQTSDEYLLEKSREWNIYEIRVVPKRSWSDKFSSFVKQTISGTRQAVRQHLRETNLP